MTHEEALRSDALEFYKIILVEKSINEAIPHAEIMISYCISGSYYLTMWERVLQLLHEDLSLNFN